MEASQESLLSVGTAFKALAVWFGILVMAIANGWLREVVFIPALDSLPYVSLARAGSVTCSPSSCT